MLYRWIFVIFFVLLSIAVPPALACSASAMTEEQAQQVINDAFYIGLVQTVEVDVVDRSMSNREVKYVLQPVWPYTRPYWEPIAVRRIGLNSCATTPGKEGAIFEAVIFKKEDGFRLGSQGEHSFTGYRWERLRQETPNPKSENLLSLEDKCKEKGKKISFEHSGNVTQLRCVRKADGLK